MGVGMSGPATGPAGRFDAVLFDLLTALLDSWTLWNDVAGSEAAGLRWRQAYLKATYGAGAYRPYEALVAASAEAAGIAACAPGELARRWTELQPWPEATAVLAALRNKVRLGVVTNCSIALGRSAAALASPDFDVVVTAEEAGFYKPRREPYAAALKALGTAPARTLFVAGSAADIAGASALGMPVYWHNRIAMAPVADVAPAYHERSLSPLRALVLQRATGS